MTTPAISPTFYLMAKSEMPQTEKKMSKLAEGAMYIAGYASLIFCLYNIMPTTCLMPGVECFGRSAETSQCFNISTEPPLWAQEYFNNFGMCRVNGTNDELCFKAMIKKENCDFLNEFIVFMVGIPIVTAISAGVGVGASYAVTALENYFYPKTKDKK